ncbi:reverse transcriptase domain-containing protein [Tanacetum coccineum]
MKQNGVTNDALHLYLFLYSLTHHATAWFDHLPKNSIYTFQETASKFPSKYFPPSMVTKLRNDISNFRQLPDESLFEAFITSSSEIAALAQQMTEMRKDMLMMYRSNQQVNSVTPSCETCGGPHFYYECQATDGYTQDVYSTTRNFNSMCNTIPNPQEDIKVITTQSGMTLVGPSVPPPPHSSSSSKEVERDPETITDQDKLQEKSDIQIHSFLQMFKKLYFNISFDEALAHIPKYAKMVKDLLTNKEKLLELANTPLNENAEQCHDTCPFPATLTDNQTTELSNQSLKFENISLKKTVAQFQKDFLRMEAHCVNLELKYQNQALKEGQHGQFSKSKK